MKKIAATLLLSITAASALFAETAFWVGNAPYGASWTNEAHYAFTDLYSKDSILTVTSGDISVNVTVKDKLPSTLEGRDFGLTEQVLKELDLWGKGDATVDVKIRNGAVVEKGDIDYSDSGWYTLHLGTMESAQALEAYRKLVKRGYKPQIAKVGDKVNVKVRFIVDYEKNDAEAELKALGYPVEAEEPAPNPYL